MFKLMCFIVPAIIAVYIKYQLEENEGKKVHIVRDWIFSFIIINLFVIITALPLGSVIVTKCEQNRFHIQYGFIAVVISGIYSVILGIFCSVVALSRKSGRGSNKESQKHN